MKLIFKVIIAVVIVTAGFVSGTLLYWYLDDSPDCGPGTVERDTCIVD